MLNIELLSFIKSGSWHFNTVNISRQKKHFFQSKLATSDKFKIEIKMVIYGKNKVGLVSYDEEIAIIIESQKIHNTPKKLLKLSGK
jgi:hypothetical protein